MSASGRVRRRPVAMLARSAVPAETDVVPEEIDGPAHRPCTAAVRVVPREAGVRVRVVDGDAGELVAIGVDARGASS